MYSTHPMGVVARCSAIPAVSVVVLIFISLGCANSLQIQRHTQLVEGKSKSWKVEDRQKEAWQKSGELSLSGGKREYGSGGAPFKGDGLRKGAVLTNSFMEELVESRSSVSRSDRYVDFYQGVPVVLNEEIVRFLNYFQARGRDPFAIWLSRSGRYVSMMKSLLKQQNLPEDLVWMVLVESGFYPKAYSPAKASGPWQFIASTGERYGLISNKWIDERRDVIKSTIAAANYLKDLYEMFGSWFLAQAGYNVGEQAVARTIEKTGYNDFWKLSEIGALPKETRDYVPKIIAATLIASNPKKYGFDDVILQRAITFDEVPFDQSVDLKMIAKVAGVSSEELLALNPELKTMKTPPGHPNYKIKLPPGSANQFVQNVALITFSQEPSPSPRRQAASQQWTQRKAEMVLSARQHQVKPKETLYNIAKSYEVSVEALMEANQLSNNSQLKAYMSLTIPLERDAKGGTPAPNPTQRGKITHIVQRGDTLWNISKRYNIEVDALLKWNKRGKRTPLRPGDRLEIVASPLERDAKGGTPAPNPTQRGKITHVVQRGDTLWDISKRYNIEVDTLLKWNKRGKRTPLRPGDRLEIVASASL
ncbi:MAG: LysM peptidoglycan-binding domain-containing protein [Candidatus Tectomicrobia bacterium]|nr:LysM peptidoglycan-binding domain-containing protein [Candidatus Tectomicrobia bacterium]